MVTPEQTSGKTSTEEGEEGGERKTVGEVRKCKKDMEGDANENTKLLVGGGGRKGIPSDLESVDGLGNEATFEDLLRLVGTRGRWNALILVVSFLCSFISPLQTLSYQFLGATPDHWCHVAPLVEANWTEEQILSFAIPYNNKTGEHDSCQMYEFDYSLAAELGHDAAVVAGLTPLSNNTSVVQCYSRDFNLIQYESTVTTQWDLVCERRVLYSTTQAAVQVGKLLGYFISGYLLDRFGRRPVVVWSSLMLAVSGLVTPASPSVEVYIFLKVVTLTMTSMMYLGCFVITMETCSSQERPKTGILFLLPWAFGYMALPGIAYLVKRWQWLQVALTLPALSLFLQYWLLPESPRWLILRGRYDEALKVLRWGARINRRTLPPDHDLRVAMEKMRPTGVDKDEEEQGTLFNRAMSVFRQFVAPLCTRELRQRTLVVFFCWFTVAMVYYGIALNSTNLSADPYIYTFLGGLLEVPSYLFLWPAIIFLGRVKTLSFLYLLCALTILLLTTVILFLPEAPIAAMMFLSLCGKMAITAAFQLVWVFTAELFPTKYRSLAIGQASVLARVGSLSSSYINDILGEEVVWAPSALFGLASLVAAGLSLLLPETKGRNLPEDDKIEDDPHRRVKNIVSYESCKQVNWSAEVPSMSDTKSENKKSQHGYCNAAYVLETKEGV